MLSVEYLVQSGGGRSFVALSSYSLALWPSDPSLQPPILHDRGAYNGRARALRTLQPAPHPQPDRHVRGALPASMARQIEAFFPFSFVARRICPCSGAISCRAIFSLCSPTAGPSLSRFRKVKTPSEPTADLYLPSDVWAFRVRDARGTPQTLRPPIRAAASDKGSHTVAPCPPRWRRDPARRSAICSTRCRCS